MISDGGGRLWSERPFVGQAWCLRLHKINTILAGYWDMFASDMGTIEDVYMNMFEGPDTDCRMIDPMLIHLDTDFARHDGIRIFLPFLFGKWQSPRHFARS